MKSVRYVRIMAWFKPLTQRSRLTKTIYLEKSEIQKLEKEAEAIKNLLSSQNNTKQKISFSDVIRIKLFFTDEYVKLIKKMEIKK